jgi:Mlc titration factor MtfA (ptsG expression regulator)
MLRWLRNRRRKRLTSAPWPAVWSRYLKRNVRLSRRMRPPERTALQKRIKVIVAEKFWEGCHGLQLTDEMRVTIAAHASLLLMGTEDFYFDNVRTILVYPQAFLRQAESGWVIDETHRSGEAWQGGPVVLSWQDVLRGGRNEYDGRNVVIHEFAHALDGLDGEMGGQIVFEDKRDMHRWKQVVDREFRQLVRARDLGTRTFLDHYGATSRAEFFAVSSESFFEAPRELQHWHPELFDLLRAWYRVNPVPWQD